MASRKAQSKAGVPERRRGQQMGDDRSQADKTLQAKDDTPALSGRRQSANKFFADESSQQAGARPESPRDNTPSTPAALPTGVKQGESGGEREFKQRQKKGK